jgi:pilus assembly protein Flp/PilA
MLRLYCNLASRLRSEEGQGMVEYALIVGLVSVGVIALLMLLGTQIGEIFTQITATLRQVPGVSQN